MKEDPLSTRVSAETYPIAVWLRSLAVDTLEHGCCPPCILNAATALEKIGELEQALARLGIEDPRVIADRDGVFSVRSKNPRISGSDRDPHDG
jgi:hypothetical protein